jgi:YVTN family beta-propeller protein
MVYLGPIRLSMIVRVVLVCLCLAVFASGAGRAAMDAGGSFLNFETAPVHPLALGPDNSRLAVCNLADGRLEVFDITTGNPVLRGSVPVGMDPVSVRFRTAREAWVVNHVSDSISVVDLNSLRVVATIDTLDTPADVVFAGSPVRAFVSCALPNTVQVFDAATRQLVTNLTLEAERPKALAVSPDGQRVYAAIFESGNGTTLVGARFRNQTFFDNAVSATNGPYRGQNPPPNHGDTFNPPLNPSLPTNLPPPATGLIVRKNSNGRWLDDNQRDWTEFVSGTNASMTQRVPGWDLPDRDLAIIDTADHAVSYATGLMNICMTVAVNPASGRVAVVGTDAMNEVRFEPNLNGTFARVLLALVDPFTRSATVKDLNPHLDYTTRHLPDAERDKSVGDPRALVWTADGSRGYVAGMGSRNVAVIDAEGSRLRALPIETGEGPCGLALDEARQRLYIFNRFSSSLSVVHTASETVLNAVPLFDPTPPAVAAGRRHLYDTRRTSGLGQASCASCHVDARMDRLAWDLGNPAGEATSAAVNHQSLQMVTNQYHPMKGVMLTQTLQDIIGHEPFHWRGDRPDLESFNATFTNLQGAATALTTLEMRELRDFLASIRFPPNPNRKFDNSLPTNLPLAGHFAPVEGLPSPRPPLPSGNAVAGLAAFTGPGNFCVSCHSLPTGLGRDALMTPSGAFTNIPPGPNGGHHFPLASRLEGALRSKNAQFRNLAERAGMDKTRLQSRAGFGFGHDGSVDSPAQFLSGLRVVGDQEIADLLALLLSGPGADVATEGAIPDMTPPAAVGRQLTVSSPARPPLLDAMLALAQSPASRVELVARGLKDGVPRGWVHQQTNHLFQSDRRSEAATPDELLALAVPGSELTFTVVPRGAGVRLGLDRDLDGVFDRDELDAGTNPADRRWCPRILVDSTEVAVGMDLRLEAQLPPAIAPGGTLAWSKDGTPIAGATKATLILTNVSFADAGDYRLASTTAFDASTSAPVRITVVPLIVRASPETQTARRGSNALFSATTVGVGPFGFQWLRDGQTLPGMTNDFLIVSNAQVADERAYQAAAVNAFGGATSSPVRLLVLVNPFLALPPLNQRVVEGGNATFSFAISGHPPPFGYQLRRSSVSALTNYVSADTTGFLSLFNVQPDDAASYRIIVTNAANPSPGLTLGPVTLTVLADFDHDGLPDEWEAQHGLQTNNPADGGLDADLDGVSNAQEYQAGTNPNDAESLLKVERLLLTPGGLAAVIQFRAASNQTYTVQHQPALAGGWTKLADVVALPTNRLVSITNALGGGKARYHRLVTPRAP